MQPFPAEPAEPVYTFHITPSTPEARERIADGAEQPELLRGTLAQGRDLARLLDASIDLLDGRGYLTTSRATATTRGSASRTARPRSARRPTRSPPSAPPRLRPTA